MKRMEIFCSSPGSTAICSSIDHRSMVRQSHKTLLDHHESPRTSTSSRINKILNKPFQNHHVPCSSELLPIKPKPYNDFEKTRKSTSSSYSSSSKKSSAVTESLRRKSSADIYDLKSHLLSEKSSFVVDWFPNKSDDSEPTKTKFRSLSSNDSSSSALMVRSSSTTTRSRHQVVVLRVSLHCKGCEGKVKKHLSKMEGVTSFSTDLASKKVTVMGDITPLGVLASVSKVKTAQLWPSSPISSSSSSSSSSSPWSA